MPCALAGGRCPLRRARRAAHQHDRQPQARCSPLSADPAALAPLRLAAVGRPVFAAASTHPDEESAVIEAHHKLRADFPKLLTVIAPRHPDRGAEVAAIATGSGLATVQRSQGVLPDATTEIYVFDTLGELGLVYRLASVVFMGGSLVPHGGQNPIEPIKLGAAVVHGPHVANFADLYRALDDASRTDAVIDSDALATRLAGLLGNTPARARLATAGRRTVDALAGAVDRSMAAIEPYLAQIRLTTWPQDA